jgi:hypothetical protein
MAKGKMDELQQKKFELQADLNKLHHELDHSIDRVRTEVRSQLDPKRVIRDYPFISVGTAVLAGFLLGHKRHPHKKKKKKKHRGDTVADTVIDGLKGIAAKKAITMAVNFVEKRFAGGK